MGRTWQSRRGIVGATSTLTKPRAALAGRESVRISSRKSLDFRDSSGFHRTQPPQASNQPVLWFRLPVMPLGTFFPILQTMRCEAPRRTMLACEMLETTHLALACTKRMTSTLVNFEARCTRPSEAARERKVSAPCARGTARSAGAHRERPFSRDAQRALATRKWVPDRG
jgi:hypothetical protein